MFEHTFSKGAMLAATAILLALGAAPVSAEPKPEPSPDATQARIDACLAPLDLGGTFHSADVVQGWIDACRAEVLGRHAH